MIEIKIAQFVDLKSIKVIDLREEMINISKLGSCVCVYLLPDMIPYLGNDIWVKKSVAEKLGRISICLQNKFPSYRLKIVYGYRHPQVQQKWFNKIKEELRLLHTNIDEEKLNELANTMVANPLTAGHPTGGAVDVTITTPDGDLDMGTAYADFSDPEKFKMFSEKITKEQMANRMLLHDLMLKEEFAPYYGEWWHYSYGDREWAWFYKKPNAVYDQIDFRTESGVLIEAGHYYAIKGITGYSLQGKKICRTIRKQNDKTMLFVDDVHGLNDMFENERLAERLNTDGRAYCEFFNFVVMESELIAQTADVMKNLETLGKIKTSKSGKYFSGIKLFHENGFPTCVMLDVCLTFKKRNLGYNHLINILPEFYLPQQEKTRQVISKILPEIKLEIILFESEDKYRYL